MIMRTMLLRLCCLVTLPFVAVSGQTPAHAEDTVKVGLIMTYTGQFTDAATQMDNGIKLYMKQHGDTVAGKKIEIIRKDDGGLPDNAKRIAQDLVVNDHVDVLAGFVITPEALTVADISAQAKKLMVVMNAATSIITTKSPYIVRTSTTLPEDCEPLGTWAAKNGIKKVFTMVSDYGPGHDAETAFSSAFKAGGGEVIDSVQMPMASPDFSAFLQRAKDSGADGIFVFIPGGSQPGALGKALVERGIDASKLKLLGHGELADESAVKAMGDTAVGIITSMYYDYNDNSKLNHDFVAAYNAEFKRNPDLFSVGGYDGMHLIYEALKKTGGKADGDSLVAAAKGMAWDSPRGQMSIDPETRDVVNTVSIRRAEKVNGQIRNVVIAKFENVKDPVKERMKQTAK
jgi:branched-chain amino acid transport system substrate-binding protein